MMHSPVPYRAVHAPHHWGERLFTVAKNAKVAKELRAGLQSAVVQHLTMGRPIALAPFWQRTASPDTVLLKRWPACFAKALKS